MSDRVRRIAPEERTAGLATAGMVREEAIATDRMWAGLVRTDAGMLSGWHHHGGYQTAIFVLSGALRMEFGPGGREALEAGPGDFVYVEPGGVHRESNPSDEESRIVVVRAGDGQPVFNVDGPRNRVWMTASAVATGAGIGAPSVCIENLRPAGER